MSNKLYHRYRLENLLNLFCRIFQVYIMEIQKLFLGCLKPIGGSRLLSKSRLSQYSAHFVCIDYSKITEDNIFSKKNLFLLIFSPKNKIKFLEMFAI